MVATVDPSGTALPHCKILGSVDVVYAKWDALTEVNRRPKTLPATLLVNRDGTFAFGGVGAREWNSEQTRNEILPLFD